MMKNWKLYVQALTFLIFFQTSTSAQNHSNSTEKNEIADHSLLLVSKAPSFLYHGDHVEFSIGLQNLSDSELTGQVQLELFDALNHQSVDGWFINSFPNQYFTVAAHQKESLNFPIQVPFNFDEVVLYRFTALCNQQRQVKQDFLPVLGYMKHQTESVNISKTGDGNFRLEKLLQSEADESIRSSSLIVEGSANPTQVVVQSFPYLLTTSFNGAIETWNKLYAIQLSKRLQSGYPKQKFIKVLPNDSLHTIIQNRQVFAVISEDQPWVLQERKQENFLNDLLSTIDVEEESLEKLKQMQKPDGSFSWMEGGSSDAFTTEYILAGLGRLKKMQLRDERMNFILKALDFLDRKFVHDFEMNNLLVAKQIPYLYARSFFPEIPLKENAVKNFSSVLKQMKQNWAKQSTGLQPMVALILFRNGDSATAKTIVQSLKKTIAVKNKKQNDSGNSWWQQKTSSDALLLEAFTEISGDKTSMLAMIKELMARKGIRCWSSPVQTADAAYALLLASEKFEEEETIPLITLGNLQVTKDDSEYSEYLEHIVAGRDVKPEMGKITVHSQSTAPVDEALPFLGTVYWNYVQDSSSNNSSNVIWLDRTLSQQKRINDLPAVKILSEGAEIHTGDTIRVNIVLHVLKDMDYVHLKDTRPACTLLLDSPEGMRKNVALQFYQIPGLADIHFFMDHLKKGTYSIQYRLLANQSGSFSTGASAVECLYAPQYRAEIKGTKILVENNGN